MTERTSLSPSYVPAHGQHGELKVNLKIHDVNMPDLVRKLTDICSALDDKRKQ